MSENITYAVLDALSERLDGSRIDWTVKGRERWLESEFLLLTASFLKKPAQPWV